MIVGPEKGQQPDLPSSAAVNRGRWKWDGKEQAKATAVECCAAVATSVEQRQNSERSPQKDPKLKAKANAKTNKARA